MRRPPPPAAAARRRRRRPVACPLTFPSPPFLSAGVGFGAIGSARGASFGGAVSLALGIGIQNFPEGLAVSLPLMREGVSPLRAFWYGQLSGIVEPLGGVLGAAFVHYCRPMLPFTMSLAAGAMIFVVCDSLVPEMQARRETRLGLSGPRGRRHRAHPRAHPAFPPSLQAHGNKALAMQGLMLGFVVMMILDVSLG